MNGRAACLPEYELTLGVENSITGVVARVARIDRVHEGTFSFQCSQPSAPRSIRGTGLEDCSRCILSFKLLSVFLSLDRSGKNLSAVRLVSCVILLVSLGKHGIDLLDRNDVDVSFNMTHPTCSMGMWRID